MLIGPSDAAINSLHEFGMRGMELQSNQRPMKDDILEGKDEFGCLLMRHDLNAWWIGSILSIGEARELVPGQNATTVQVAIGVGGGGDLCDSPSQCGIVPS